MKQTELIIFVIILVINAGFAIAKKYKERKAAKAASGLMRSAGSETTATRKSVVVRQAPPTRPAPPMRTAATAPRTPPVTARTGGATAIDARGVVRREIRDSELQAAAARRRQAEARLFEQQVAAEKARITAQQRKAPPAVQRSDSEPAATRPKATVSPKIISSRITANSIGSPRDSAPARAQALLRDRAGLRRALILREILGPPRSMVPFGGTP
jgi:hypothetical protein